MPASGFSDGVLDYVGSTTSGTPLLKSDFTSNVGGQIESVTLLLSGTAVRPTAFTYWGGTTVNLQSVANEEPPLPWETAWQRCDTTFFTWHGTANAGLLKHVLRDHAYQRMLSAGLDPATATDEQLDAFADEKFTWHESKVQSEATHGGR